MAQLIHWPGSLALAAAVLALTTATPDASGQAPRGPKVNPEAAVLADFQKRLADYQKLRDKASRGAAAMKTTTEPAEIKAAQQALAERIRAARADARPGDIFTPDIRTAFRRLMYPEVHGPEGGQTKAAIEEDAPKALPLKVNADYPEGEPRPTVPPNILANLPRLPQELDYRVIDKHLILHDVDANLIVDFIPHAIR
jgi:hypothetical protein